MQPSVESCVEHHGAVAVSVVRRYGLLVAPSSHPSSHPLGVTGLHQVPARGGVGSKTEMAPPACQRLCKKRTFS